MIIKFLIQLRVQVFKQRNSSKRQKKWEYASFSKFYGKMWDGFCLNTGKRFLLGVLF